MTDSDLSRLVARTEGAQPWRRVFHAANGLLIAGGLLVWRPSWEVAVGLLAAAALGAFLLDGLRFAVPSLNRLFFKVLRPFASPREAAGIASSTWYLVGALLAVAAFPRTIAAAAILVLAFADPAASYIGRRWGRRPTGTGTWLGTGVFAGVATLVLLPFAHPLTALLVGLGTAWIERTRWPRGIRIDDNLLVPLVAGALLWTLVPLF
jgi:dolichol kinase